MENKEKRNHLFYKQMIDIIAKQSKCKSRKIGAIIVKDGRIIAEGWNGAPPNCDENKCIRCESDHESGKNLSNAICQHAETNAISSAAYLGFSLKDAEIYVTNKPCSDCSKTIVSCGIKKVYYFQDYISEYTDYIFKNNKIEIKKIEGI